jgi:hypothetical protein
VRLFPIPFALWLVVTVSWFLGAEGFSVRTNTGQKATIDFNRKYDESARMLTADIAVLSGGDGALVKLKRAWIPYCWLCGNDMLDGTLVQFATHQRDSWIYRAPAPDPNFTGWTNQRGIAAALVLAYDLRRQLFDQTRETRARLAAQRRLRHRADRVHHLPDGLVPRVRGRVVDQEETQ